MKPMPSPNFNLNKKFLKDHLDAFVSVSTSDAVELGLALQDPAKPVPPGEFVLGKITATASGGGKVELGGGAIPGSVTFSGTAGASFSMGIYLDASNALKAISPGEELARGMNLTDAANARYVVLQAAYDVSATAKGSVALGTGASANFGITGTSNGLFAVIHRFDDTEPAVAVFQNTFSNWALPRQIDQQDDLKPGTWIVAEVDGSIAATLGVTAGYDFSWIREITNGALQGDIGLRVQLGASAALGFETGGKYAVVVARESALPFFRLRIYKMAKKSWNFALNAQIGFDAELPPALKNDKPEELIVAIFGLNNSQLLEDLKQIRAFINSNASLNEKLAGVVMTLGGKAIEEITGLKPNEIQAVYERGRARIQELTEKLDELTETAGHDLTSMLLSFSPVQLQNLQTALKAVAESDVGKLQELLRSQLSKAGFDRTPIGNFVEIVAGVPLLAINSTDEAMKVRSVAKQTLDILNGKALQEVLDFIKSKIGLDKITAITNAADFATVDNWLKARLAAFLGKQEVLLADVQNIQNAIAQLLGKADKFCLLAVAAAQKHQQFAWASTYSRSTTRSALIDVTFDVSKTGNFDRLRKAINGEFQDVLLQQIDGITIGAAELSHNTTRNVSTEFTMPFGSKKSSIETVSSARMRVVEDDGRVFVYTIDAIDKDSERDGFFRARAGRDSTLTLSGTMPLGVGGEVRKWKEASFSYAYSMVRAVQRMRVSQMESEIGPVVAQYVPGSFSGGRNFSEWVADLDKFLDGQDPNSGTHDIGDTRIALNVTAPSAYLQAWTKAPADEKDVRYLNLARGLQAELKKIISFFYFSDPSRYGDLGSAASPIVYSCLPVRSSTKFDTRDLQQIEALVRSDATRGGLERYMNKIAGMLRGIPDLSGSAKFYDFTPGNYSFVVSQSLRRQAAGSPRPEFLGSLLDVEERLIENAIAAGIEMARFRELAPDQPARALQKLAEFGEDITRTFNSEFAHNPFLSDAARPLGTVFFLQAARAFDPALPSNGTAALLNITVIKSGQASIEDMLKNDFDRKGILFEQPFVEG